MEEHFLLESAAVIMSATLLLYIPIWAIALSKNKLKTFDFICPFIPILVWFVMTYAGIGSQEYINLIEIPIIMFITLLGCIYMMFSPYHETRTIRGKFIVFIVVSLIAVLLRLYFHE
ncbi:MAG: hypothetical protein GXO47_14460 [Chlorobi bacterium]|nr:hypothetical protein [Chlorobiota bacterium]